MITKRGVIVFCGSQTRALVQSLYSVFQDVIQDVIHERCDSCDHSDRTFVFIKNIYKSKNRHNCQTLQS